MLQSSPGTLPGPMRGSHRRTRKRLLASAALAALLPVSAATAQEFHWTSSTSGLWSNPANWTDTPPPVGGGDLVFLHFHASGTTSYTATNDLGNPFDVNEIWLHNTGTGAITLAGNALRITGPEPFIDVVNAGPAVINNNLILDVETMIWSEGPGTLLLGGSITGSAGLTFIEGSVYLTGAGTSYSGPTIITNTGGTIFAAAHNTLSPNSTIVGQRFGRIVEMSISTAKNINSSMINPGNYNQTIGGLAGFGEVSVGSATLTVGANNASTTFSGQITGTADSHVIKVGTGAWQFNGEMTTDFLTINSGSVVLGNQFGLVTPVVTVNVHNGLNIENVGVVSLGGLGGTGDLNLGSSTLALTMTKANTTYSGILRGTGSLNKGGGATLTLTGANTYSGGTMISGGILNINSDDALGAQNGSITFAGGGLQLASSFNLASTRDITIFGSGRIDTQQFNTTINQSIGEVILSGVLIKRGSGTLTLGGNNSYAGGTVISQGTIVATNSNALGSTGTVTIGDSFSAGHDNTLLLGPGVNLVRDIVIVPTGISSNLGSTAGTTGPAIFSGDIELGRLTTVQAGNSTPLDSLNSPGQTRFDGEITGIGGLRIIGGNMVQFRGGAKTYTGITQVLEPDTSLSLFSAASAPVNSAVQLDPGTFLILEGISNATIGGLAGSGTVTNNNAAGASSINIGNNNANTVFSGAITGDVALTKIGTGTLTLAGANTYTGSTTITDGTLQIGQGGATGSIPGNVLNNSHLAFNRSNDFSFNGTISGTGALTKDGAGTLTLADSNSYSGPTTLKSGTLAVSSSTNLGDNSATNGIVFDGGALRTNAALNLTRSLSVNATGGTLDTAAQTLTLSGAGDTTLVGNLTVTGGGTLALSRTGGTVSVSPGASLTIDSGATVNLSGSPMLSDGTNHAHVINNSTTSLNVLAGVHNLGPVDGSGSMNVAADATAIVDRVRQDTLNIDGTVRVRPNGSADGVVVLNNLVMSENAVLDLNDNDLLVNYTGASPLPLLMTLVLAGYSPVSDLGRSGIISSTSQNMDGTTILVLLDNALLNLNEWLGIPIDSTTIIGKYTFFGDANLDGQVTEADADVIRQNLGMTGALWYHGDLNFDGRVTGDDFAIMVSHLGLGVGNPLGSALPIPEPGSAVGGLLAATLLGRRRRTPRTDR